MEKAILKTLIYADIFDYPLKAWEIHKWLIGKKGTLHQVEKALKRKRLESGIKNQEGYYFLKNRKGLVKKRLDKERSSNKLFKRAVWVGNILRVIPWIKLIGVSGNLAMKNSTRKDDIDFFIITQSKRLWISRLLVLLVLGFLGKRRSREDKEVGGKVCVNLLLEEDQLIQKKKDLYTAHEVLQMRVLWQRENIYSKFLEENEWVFKFLPNWTSSVRMIGDVRGLAKNAWGPVKYTNDGVARHSHARESNSLRSNRDSLRVRTSSHSAVILGNLLNFLEVSSRFVQLRYMGEVRGKERISESALYFHPLDYRERILKEYNKALEKFR